MKKFLLFAAAAIIAASASAETQKVIASMYPGDASLIGWGGNSSLEVVTEDGREALKLTNPEVAENDWNVQFAFDFNYEVGTTYYFTFDVKGDPSDGIGSGFQCTDGYIGCGNMNSFPISADWNTVTISGTVTNPGDGKSVDRWVASYGNYAGSFYISKMTLYVVEENGDDPVSEEKVLKAFYDGNGATFGGWGATFDNVEEEGKPCLKYTNEEAKDNWAAQMAIDYDYEAGETYYFSFDIKGDAGNVTSGFQYAGLNNAGEQVYWSCGNVSNFAITPEWNHVVISGKAEAAQEGQNPGRWVANLGDYVGTFYMTNVKLYVLDNSGVKAISPDYNSRIVVYTLQGIKVLDSENNDDMKVLPRGIYIVNGKKMIIGK